MDINSCRNDKIRQAPIAIHLSLRILYHKILSCRVIQLIQYPWGLAVLRISAKPNGATKAIENNSAHLD